MKKRCRTCKRELPLSAFNIDRRAKDGLCGQCRACAIPEQKRYRQSEKGGLTIKRNGQSDKARATQKAYRKSARGKIIKRQRRIKDQYGITLEDYDQMFEQQNGVCAICHKSETALSQFGGVRRLAVDHNHKTGQVRGLLCTRCNSVIGYVYEDVTVLLEAAVYLERNER